MLSYIIRRILYMIPMFFLISIICFVVIQLPSGDYLTNYIHNLEAQGTVVSKEAVQILRERYGLSDPFYIQYLKWIGNIVIHGDFGESFIYRRPVSQIIGERLPWTVGITFGTLVLTWMVGLPLGIYSATHQYSVGDNILTVIGFLGLSIPNFFLALFLMFASIFVFNVGDVGGLFSPEYVGVPWSWAKFTNLLEHVWAPILVIGTGGLAGVMRRMRGNLLDALKQPYMQTARSKGLSERRVVYKHGVRNAINPLIMSLGMSLPSLIEGAIISSIVLNLPTTGVVFYQAIRAQDTYLAGSFLLMLSVLLMVGNLLGDILLSMVDPRVRYE